MTMAWVTIDREYLRVYAKEIAIVGLDCSICGKKLRLGSLVDGFFPYFIENNRHKKCKP